MGHPEVIERLKQENAYLKLEVDILQKELDEKQLKLDDLLAAIADNITYVPLEWGMTKTESDSLLVLIKAVDVVSKETFMSALYGHRLERDMPDKKIIDVTICKIRKKLKAVGLPFEIQNVFGRGYKMKYEDRLKLREILQNN